MQAEKKNGIGATVQENGSNFFFFLISNAHNSTFVGSQRDD